MTVREKPQEISAITAAGRTYKPKLRSVKASEGADMIAGLKKHAAQATMLVFACALITPLRAQTFTKDVAPIFQKSCVSCHREGTTAPMSLMTYKDARPWARAIKERVLRRDMPPWHLDKTVGIRRYKNDISLSDAEIATIVKWIDTGAAEGNPADL